MILGPRVFSIGPSFFPRTTPLIKRSRCRQLFAAKLGTTSAAPVLGPGTTARIGAFTFSGGTQLQLLLSCALGYIGPIVVFLPPASASWPMPALRTSKPQDCNS